MVELLVIVVGITIPLAIYFWHDSRRKNPAHRWPVLAEMTGMQYAPNPPRVFGEWKGRKVVLAVVEGGALIATPLRCKNPIRVELGPKDAIEKEAGMVVPDRVQLNDTAFENRFMVRATPPEYGEAAFDHSLRQRILHLPDIRIMAVSRQLDMRVPNPTEGGELRDYLDVVASIADAIDG